MIVVTGGAGFIGSNLVRALSGAGHDVVVVDDASGQGPSGTLVEVPIADHVGQAEFLARIRSRRGLAGVEAVLHQGGCSSTAETDWAYLTATNVRYSMDVLAACRAACVPLVYASSAAVYGCGTSFSEEPEHLAPANPYARSKAEFDRHVGEVVAPGEPVVGLRYFNVYGPGEAHKGSMASQALQLWRQLEAGGPARLFGAGAGCGPGQHRRDFVHVDDVVAVVRWFLDHPTRTGIYNCGTGRSATFQRVAELVIEARGGAGAIEYVPFPAELEGRYQATTCADLARLRAAGCHVRFAPVEEGIPRYVAALGAP